METKFTKGEWKTTILSTTDQLQIQSEKIHCVFIDERISSVKPALAFGKTIEEAEANAKLIAAAPDMLDVLKSLFKEVYDGNLQASSSLVTQMNKAIKKATE